MAITMTIPTALRQHTNNTSTVTLEPGNEQHTVASALRALVTQYPNIANNLFTETGTLRSFVNIYVGDEDIRFLDGVDTTLRDGDTVSIIPAIAGGNTSL